MDDAGKFIDCLQDARQLLKDYPALNNAGVDHALNYKASEHFDLALFDKWPEILEPILEQKSRVRVIHQLSCTGGTLICKCLAGLPNVALLSEVNPVSEIHLKYIPRFEPTDLLFLAKQGNFPRTYELSKEIFKAEITVLANHARQFGKHLVIREHSHSDFLEGKSLNGTSTVRKFLQGQHSLLSVVTIRHPVDSYLSLVRLGWNRFIPNTFDEYCRRYILFMHDNKEFPICKYEDFVNDPLTEMQRICQSLELPFNEGFLDVFDLATLSGDSGRTSNIIEKRERREFYSEFQKEVNESSSYQDLCKLMGYELKL